MNSNSKNNNSNSNSEEKALDDALFLFAPLLLSHVKTNKMTLEQYKLLENQIINYFNDKGSVLSLPPEITNIILKLKRHDVNIKYYLKDVGRLQYGKNYSDNGYNSNSNSNNSNSNSNYYHTGFESNSNNNYYTEGEGGGKRKSKTRKSKKSKISKKSKKAKKTRRH